MGDASLIVVDLAFLMEKMDIVLVPFCIFVHIYIRHLCHICHTYVSMTYLLLLLILTLQ